jgi:hypothetical protein
MNGGSFRDEGNPVVNYDSEAMFGLARITKLDTYNLNLIHNIGTAVILIPQVS